MSLKKTGKFLIIGFLVSSFIFLYDGKDDIYTEDNDYAENNACAEKDIYKYSENIENICLDLYKKAADEKRQSDLDIIRSIVNRFGEHGYPAVDSKNQIDMVNAESVVQFCEAVDLAATEEITIIEVDYFGGFIQYDIKTKDGSVDVVKRSYRYENEKFLNKVTESYRAEYWDYTEEGYLMFYGICNTDATNLLMMNGLKVYTALRVQPLDEVCRELNRKYVIPIGYKKNNMFLTDWSGEDFGSLNFYDMYDIFYPEIHKEAVPYEADDNLGTGTVYLIPEDEFEKVIMSYFNIDSETLKKKAVYNAKASAYEYRPRGFYEVEYPEYPYSEVIKYKQNGDGTITLIVNVVFPYAMDSKVYVHELTLRPSSDGSVKYISNKIISAFNDDDIKWHTTRLTKNKWSEIYG